MRTKRLAGVLACVLMQLATTAAAGAPQGAGEGAASDKDRARALFVQGSEAYGQGRWDQCRTTLSEAWGILKQWQIAVNLGACELKLGMHRDAAEHLSFGLRELPASAGAEKRAEVTALLDEAAKNILMLTIRTDPSDAEVLLDGKSIGRGPFDAPVPVEPGTHAIEIRADERKPFKGSITGKPGERQELMQSLEPVPAEPPPPPKKAAPPPAPIRPEEPEAPGPRVVPLVIGGAATVIALGVGVGLTIAANGKASDAQALQQGLDRSACAPPPQNAAACNDLNDALTSKDSLSNGALVSFVVAGALGLGTAGFAMWELSRTGDGGEVRAAPAVGMSGAGMVVSGAW